MPGPISGGPFKTHTLKEQTHIAKTFAGLEQVLADEMESLGAQQVQKLRRGVSFEGDQRMLYKANIHCRTALSILKPLADFRFDTREDFYEQVRQVSWTELFPPGKTISVIATAHDSTIFNNTMFLAQVCKDAVVDTFNDACGRRPDVDTANADIRIVVNVFGDVCKLSLDSSGDALFKRGYRRATGQAPINEVLAAGLISLSGWDKESLFLDPMCGSGTFAIEAAMMGTGMAPCVDRRQFGFSHWNDFDEALLEEERTAAREGVKPLKANIIASDLVGKLLDITRQNVMNAGLLGRIQVQKNDFFTYRPREDHGWLILNPPYGHRMKREDVRALYIHIGDALKNHFTGFNAGIISAELESMKHIGLRPSKRFPVYNGPLKATFNVYELFAGKRDDHLRDNEKGSASEDRGRKRPQRPGSDDPGRSEGRGRSDRRTGDRGGSRDRDRSDRWRDDSDRGDRRPGDRSRSDRDRPGKRRDDAGRGDRRTDDRGSSKGRSHGDRRTDDRGGDTRRGDDRGRDDRSYGKGRSHDNRRTGDRGRSDRRTGDRSRGSRDRGGGPRK